MKKSNLKNQQGFTLVEVIVVAIIVAALAAVAIPLYSNYVITSKNNMAANTAGAVASYIGACKGLGGSPTGIEATDKTGPVIVACDSNKATIGVPKGIHISMNDSARIVKANGSVSTAAPTADSPNQEYAF